MGIPVVSSWSTLDSDFFFYLIFLFTLVLSFLIIMATFLECLPHRSSSAGGLSLSVLTILQSKYLLDHFTDKKLRVMDIKQFSQGVTQSARCRGGIQTQAYITTQSIFFPLQYRGSSSTSLLLSLDHNFSTIIMKAYLLLPVG